MIPGNQNLSEAEQEARAQCFHWPYHHAIDRVFAHLRLIGPEPLLFSVHTFTPSLGGEDRFWDVGVLWNRDPRLPVPLISMLRQHEGLNVGDNEPYSGRRSPIPSTCMPAPPVLPTPRWRSGRITARRARN